MRENMDPVIFQKNQLLFTTNDCRLFENGMNILFDSKRYFQILLILNNKLFDSKTNFQILITLNDKLFVDRNIGFYCQTGGSDIFPK